MSRFMKTVKPGKIYNPHVNHVFDPDDKEACDDYFNELSTKIKPSGFIVVANDYQVPGNVENYYDDSCVGMAVFSKSKSNNEKILDSWLTKINAECDFCQFQAFKMSDTKFYITAYFD